MFAYLREHEEERMLVALNFGLTPGEVNFSEAGRQGELLCSTPMDQEGGVDLTHLALRLGEGAIVRLTC